MIIFFDVCDNLNACDFYLQVVEKLREDGIIKEIEMYALRRIGRTKRLELLKKVEKPTVKPEKPGVYIYTPEMGQGKPDCEIYASLSHDGRHEYLYTDITLHGRGIKFIDEKAGEKRYRVTSLAFSKLEKQYTIGRKVHLD